jgi:hypothetical protein
MAPKGIKASKIHKRKSKAKAIEWVAWDLYQGTKYILVEGKISKNQQAPARDNKEMEVDGHLAELEEAGLSFMDVNETSWIEEQDAPEQRRVH